MTAEDLRKEARAAEFMAAVVSYRPDKTRLLGRAAELRRRADELEERVRALGGPCPAAEGRA